MKKVNKKLLKVVERAMRNEAVHGIDGFPPLVLEYGISRKDQPIRRKNN